MNDNVNDKKIKVKQTIFSIMIGVLLIIVLIVCLLLKDDINNSVDNSSSSITVSGTHELTGEYQCLTVNTLHDVKLILNDAKITCETGPAIYIEESGDVEIIIKGKNKISATTTEEFEGALHSKEDLVLSGDGSLEIASNYDGIVSRDSMIINSGTYIINSEQDGVKAKDDLTINGGTFAIDCNDDGVRAQGKVEINGGEFEISAREGIEGTYIIINDGALSIEAFDDGINAGSKSDVYDVMIEINGGEITINMSTGDTDAIDSNGDLKITGGKIDITAESPFDYDGNLTFTGGTIIVNGVTTDSITNQFGGDMPGMLGEPATADEMPEMPGDMPGRW